MERCIKCVMPKSASGIFFNEEGLCNLCQNYKPHSVLGVDALKEELRNHTSVNSKYDCIVPVSGGRDSSYALYFTKIELGLNPLAVHNDNDFETEQARINLKAITGELDVDLVITNTESNLAKKIVREKMEMNAPFGVELVAAQTCEACEYGFESAAHNVAKREGVKAILWGDSNSESTQSYHDLVEAKMPSKIEKLLSPGVVNRLKYHYYFKKLKKKCGPKHHSGIIPLHLFDFIEWDRRKIVSTIENALGWSKPKGGVTTWRTDCTLVPLVSYLYKKSYGVSKLELGFSNMIRDNKMSRDKAIEEVEQMSKDFDISELEKFLYATGVKEKTIKLILN